MKRRPIILVVIAFLLSLGCSRSFGPFEGHRLGESLAEFKGVEHPATQNPPGTSFTGTIHCFETPTLGDQCKAKRNNFDNAHFTFLNDKLTSIEAIGAGGIIGDAHQNWNWNLYLSILNKRYGKPDKMTPTDALWTRGHEVIHAYLTQGPLMFNSGTEAQEEHIKLQTRDAYNEDIRN